MTGVLELTPLLGAGGACKAMGWWRGAPKRQHARAQRAAMVGPHRPRAARPSPAFKPSLDGGLLELRLFLLRLDCKSATCACKAAICLAWL